MVEVCLMSKQGLYGAFEQYWTVDEAPRLNRRNTYFRDHQVSSYDALKVSLVVLVLAIAIVIFWSVGL